MRHAENRNKKLYNLLLQTKCKDEKSEEAVLQQKLSSLHNARFCVKTLRKKLLQTITRSKWNSSRFHCTKQRAQWFGVRLGGANRGNVGLAIFFNLEKRNHSNEYTAKLRVENRTLTSPDEILNEEHRYYKRLHTSSRTNPNDPRFDVFFDSSTLPKLSPPQADSCDGLLTKKECYVSFKSFSKGKSPGTGGLTTEFYLSFWELLGQELVDSFHYAFEKGEMSIYQKRGIITLNSKERKNRTLLNNWSKSNGGSVDEIALTIAMKTCFLNSFNLLVVIQINMWV